MVDTGDVSTLSVSGLFYGIGHQPNSHLFKGDIELDEAGYVKVKPCSPASNPKRNSWSTSQGTIKGCLRGKFKHSTGGAKKQDWDEVLCACCAICGQLPAFPFLTRL